LNVEFSHSLGHLLPYRSWPGRRLRADIRRTQNMSGTTWVEPLVVGLERSPKRNAAAEAGAAVVNDAGKMIVMKQLNAYGAF